MPLAKKEGWGTVIPLRPLESTLEEPMRTWFYHEFGYQQGLEIKVRGKDAMQRVRDIERLIEVVIMVKRWADEDGTWLRQKAKELADEWWEQEMREFAALKTAAEAGG